MIIGLIGWWSRILLRHLLLRKPSMIRTFLGSLQLWLLLVLSNQLMMVLHYLEIRIMVLQMILMMVIHIVQLQLNNSFILWIQHLSSLRINWDQLCWCVLDWHCILSWKDSYHGRFGTSFFRPLLSHILLRIVISMIRTCPKQQFYLIMFFQYSLTLYLIDWSWLTVFLHKCLQ